MNILYRYHFLVIAFVVLMFPRYVISAAFSTTFVQHAINPTKSGQIGINPVVSDLGPETQYVGPIGENTEILVAESGTTKWIGTGDFIVQTIITTVISNQPTAITSGVQMVASTAAADAEGQKKGDVAITIGEALRDKLSLFAEEAVAACKLVKKIRRDYNSDAFTQCLSQAAAESSGPDGPLGEVLDLESLIPAAPKSIELEFDQLIALYEIAKTQLRLRAFYLLEIVALGFAAKETVDYVVNLPAAPKGLIAPSPTPTAGCAAGAPTGINAPICAVDDCQGLPQDLKCTTGKWKDCDCLATETLQNENFWDTKYFDFQQDWLAQVAAMPDFPTDCTIVNGGSDWEGMPFYDPPEWCRCQGDDWLTSLYATIPATSSPCAFTALPSTTIQSTRIIPLVTYTNPSDHPKPTSCNKIVLDNPTGSPYTSCTCNDNNVYLFSTVTNAGTPSETCIDAVALTTASIMMMPTKPAPSPVSPNHFGSPSSRNTDGGNLTCLAPHTYNDPTYYFSRDAAVQAIGQICNRISDTSKLGKGQKPVYVASQQRYLVTGGKSSEFGFVFFSLGNGNSEGVNCETLDFSTQAGRDDCKSRFMETIDGCDTSSNNAQYWKQGGSFDKGCIQVQLSRCKLTDDANCIWHW